MVIRKRLSFQKTVSTEDSVLACDILELRRGHAELLFDDCVRMHVFEREQFSWSVEATIKLLLRPPRRQEVEEKTNGCEMPLSESKSCDDCRSLVMNCRLHMRFCTAPIWAACDCCLRLLCSEHLSVCYCARGREREREKQ